VYDIEMIHLASAAFVFIHAKFCYPSSFHAHFESNFLENHHTYLYFISLKGYLVFNLCMMYLIQSK